MSALPRVSFGMIVLNGEPFVRYNLRQLYPFAHEIIVVEGANAAAASIATPDGHSTDGTLDALSQFKADEDPDGKLQIVTRDGFWREKDEQSQAYADRAAGDYLWQVDCDEFYRADEMRIVLEMLRDDPDVAAVSFKQITFWGGFDYVADGWHLRRGADEYHRLFKWGAGYRYVAHRPPTVHDAQGRDLRTRNWVDGAETARRGARLYHYSLLFPKQVREKCTYYDHADWVEDKGYRRWAEENFFGLRDPFRVHNKFDQPSWLERFRGQAPEQIDAMRRDIDAGRLDVEMRPAADVERLLRSPAYKLGRMGMKLADRLDRVAQGRSRLARAPGALLRRGVERFCRGPARRREE